MAQNAAPPRTPPSFPPDKVRGTMTDHDRQTRQRRITRARAPSLPTSISASTAGQVSTHQKARNCIPLVGRRVGAGLAAHRIEVIDERSRKIWASSYARYGFQLLIAESVLGKAWGASFGPRRIAPGLAKQSRLASRSGMVPVRAPSTRRCERLYDPCVYHDRVVLACPGFRSEAPIHQINVPACINGNAKAARGNSILCPWVLVWVFAHRPGLGIKSQSR